jgi:predicted DNA-binding transcriptional regulator YafY
MKTDIINKAIQNGWILHFDYVSRDKEISYDRLVQPVEIKEVGKDKILTLYGQDLKKGLMRSFQLEGIMEAKIIEPEKLKKEFTKNLL